MDHRARYGNHRGQTGRQQSMVESRIVVGQNAARKGTGQYVAAGRTGSPIYAGDLRKDDWRCPETYSFGKETEGTDMIVHTGGRYWGQTSTLILEYKNGKVILMDDDAGSGGIKYMTRGEDWQKFEKWAPDEEDTLA